MASKVRVLPSPPPYAFGFGWRATPKLRQERRRTDATASPMTGSSGVSSTPRPFDSITGASEYWVARSSRAMTAEGVVRVSSLRANGARERAPDDRLHEAIHFATTPEAGLLRRFRSPQRCQLPLRL